VWQQEFEVAKALAGIRVIDMTVWFQGPVAAQYLGDFGAEVIKLERPQGGDQARGVRSIKSLEIGDWNQYFLVINRNKKSMAVDLKKPGGKEIVYRLVAESDVFLSNLAPPTASRPGPHLRGTPRVNPRAVTRSRAATGDRLRPPSPPST
jgi:crotonobetainyl-CoA:carnitine CoA-transferase CaiB-like acyl-CoA transferase